LEELVFLYLVLTTQVVVVVLQVVCLQPLAALVAEELLVLAVEVMELLVQMDLAVVVVAVEPEVLQALEVALAL
jgi:hypothetical protein